MKKFRVLALTVALSGIVASAGWSESLYSPLKLGINAGATAIQDVLALLDGGMFNFRLGASLHIVPWLAVRPAVIWYSQETKSQNVFAGTGEFVTSKDFVLGGQVDLLYFFEFNANTALFSGPGFAYSTRTLSNFSSSNGNKSYERKYDEMTVPITLGLQYLFDRNFGFFVESGLDLLFKTSNRQDWNTTTGAKTGDYTDSYFYVLLKMPTIGAVFYFN